MSYSFFVTLFLTIFGGRRKSVYLVILLGIVFIIFFNGWQDLSILVAAAVAAWLIAQAVLILKQKIIKKSSKK
ncbi:MAG: hypothetical protein PHO56_04870 [Patescibacteria group bacterium]|nr:hypothetical protein [Patescibacteria group bacterium]